MNIIFTFLLSQSIWIPIGCALIRFKRLGSYQPMLVLLICGILAELASIGCIDTFKISNAPVIRIYSLLECFLLIYQLNLWKNEKKINGKLIALLGLCLILWLLESIFLSKTNSFTPFFRVFYAFVIVLLSINQINATLVYYNGSLIKYPQFIFCLGYIVFFTYQIIDEASLYVDNDKSIIASKIILGFGYINVLVNISYAFAFLLIKQPSFSRFDPHFKHTGNA